MGRLGGDEFVVLLEGASLSAGSEVVAERILDVLAPPFLISASDVPFDVTASIGIAEGDRAHARGPAPRRRHRPVPGQGRRQALRGDLFTRDAGGGRRPADLEVDLHHALDNGEFFLLYQPTVDLSSGDLHRRGGALALAPPRTAGSCGPTTSSRRSNPAA